MSWFSWKKKEEQVVMPVEPEIPAPTWKKLSRHVIQQDYPMRSGTLVRVFDFATCMMTIETTGAAFHEPKYDTPFPRDGGLLIEQATAEMEKLGGITAAETRNAAQVVAQGLEHDVVAPQKASFRRKGAVAV